MTINNDKKAEHMAVCRELGLFDRAFQTGCYDAETVKERFQDLSPEMRERIKLKFCEIAQLPTTTDTPWDQIQNFDFDALSEGTIWKMAKTLSVIVHETFSVLTNDDARRLLGECDALHFAARVKKCFLKYNKELSESALATFFKSLEQAFIQMPYDNRRNETAMELEDAIWILLQDGILTPENVLLLIDHANPVYLAHGIGILHRYGILTEENLLAVRNRRSLSPIDHHDVHLASVLADLKGVDILTSENRQAVCAHDSPKALSGALMELKRADILTPENRQAVIAHSDPLNLALILVRLEKANMLTTDIREKLSTHSYLKDLCPAFDILEESSILTQENWQAIYDHETPHILAGILRSLHLAGIILTPEERESVRTSAQLSPLAGILNGLRQTRIVPTPEEVRSLCTRPNLLFLNIALGHLQWGGIPTRGNFEQIMQRPVLYTAEMIDIWNRLPNGMLTQQVFEEIIRLSDGLNPIVQITTYVNGLVGIREEGLHRLAEAVPRLNDRQSTHTASVHASVSESAIRLMNKYDISNLDGIIAELREKINTLPSAPKNDVAKHCLARLTGPFYTFTDPTSGVSIRQLLALAYLVNKNANTDFTLFVDGLYEAQREYNLTEGGQDRGGEDSPACTAGTFNKIMEKLVGLDDAVEIIYINPKTASLKLQAAVKDYARQNNITEITEGNWPRIREGIREGMAPFREAFRTLEAFEACIEAGQHVELPDASN